MKWLALVLLSAAVFGEDTRQITVKGGVTVKGSTNISIAGTPLPPPITVIAQLPQVWANDKECNPPGGISW